MYQPSFSLLVDIRDVNYKPSALDILSITSFIKTMKKIFEGKTAILVKNQSLYTLFHLAKIYQNEKEIKANFFLKEKDALLWLNDRRLQKRPDIVIS